MDPKTLVDAAFDVCTALYSVGTEATLTGGSAATYYAPAAYQSDDIDFVLTFVSDQRASSEALVKIGFCLNRTGQHYERRDVILEFPPGPLAIGIDVLSPDQCATYRRESQILRILTATDAVRDRLIAYYAWNDFAALAAAVGIAVTQREGVDLNAIRDWTERENRALPSNQRERFNDFVSNLRRAGLEDCPQRFS